MKGAEMINKNASTNSVATVFILDENPIMRKGLVGIVQDQSGLEICGESGNPISAKREISINRPDLVTIEITFRSASGLETIKHIRAHNPQTKILVLSKLDETMHAERVIRAGANGYVMKSEPPEYVLSAINTVLHGETYLSRKLKDDFANKFIEGERLSTNSVINKLSQREFEVFCSLGQGHSPREIAEELHLSVKTVQAYCTRIKHKLNLANARTLLQSAIHWNLNSEKESDTSSASLH